MRAVLVRVHALATVAVAGVVAMGLELAAFRLYAPYFGYSVYVWGSMILVIMLALAAGYVLGGRHGRTGCSGPFYRFILGSAIYQLVMLWSAPAILEALSSGDEFAAVGVATLVIFGPPTTLLAATGPIAIRWWSNRDNGGSAAGAIYALSTAGSTIGIMLTTFVLVPRWGTHAALEVLCCLTFLAGAPGINTRRTAWAACAAPVVLLSAPPDFGWSRGTVWSSESPYNLIRVFRRGGELALTLNNMTSVHTVRNDLSPWTNYYYDDFAIGPALTHANRLLVLGMGAGGSIRATRLVSPQMEVDVVEIDPKVVEAATRYFGLDTHDPRLRVYIADARPWLAKNNSLYGLVHIDLYQGGPYIPFYLATREFFLCVRRHMAEDGVLMMNVFDPGRSAELLNAIGATLKDAFPEVMISRASSGNYMVLAFRRSVGKEAVLRNLEQAPENLARRVGLTLREFQPPKDAPVMTDDHAPVEELTRRAIGEVMRRRVN